MDPRYQPERGREGRPRARARLRLIRVDLDGEALVRAARISKPSAAIAEFGRLIEGRGKRVDERHTIGASVSAFRRGDAEGEDRDKGVFVIQRERDVHC